MNFHCRKLLQGRFIFTILTCLANMMCMLGRHSLRLARLPMTKEFNMTTEEESHVLASYSYGMTVTMVVGGPLSDIVGGKWLMFLVTLISGLCTAMVPLFSEVSFPLLVTSQVLYGLAGGLVVCALGSLIARWEPLSERGGSATIIYSGSQVSALVSALFMSYISYNQYDWRLVFYILGSLPLLWVLPWTTLVTDDPSRSRLTSEAERDMLAKESSLSRRPGLTDIPVRKILTCGPVWAMIVANVGNSWAVTFTLLHLPAYFDEQIKLPLHYNSLVSALPYLGICVLGPLSSFVFSFLKKCGLSQTATRKVCSSICLFGFALFSLPVPFIGSSSTIATVILTSAAYAMTGGLEARYKKTLILSIFYFRV